MRRLLALALCFFALTGATDAPRLVPDISNRSIEIRYSFTGAELLLFGAVVYPGGTVPDEPADVVVVLKGPTVPILMREKQKIAGLWMNAESHRFASAPGFYAVASGAPIDTLVDERTAAIYELGLENLQLSSGGGASPEESQRFVSGLIDLRQRQGLYAEQPDGIEVTDDILYRATIPIPSRVPVGTYTAETFLVRDGQVLAVASREIEIDKTGFERFVAVAAERRPFLYGLASVWVSLLLGSLAAWAFRKRA
ncbi:TIGR02186 family protein [Sphingomicrobium clamense]|uniref:TIGR02186 family protein n=1 Tax=Sphingomicrobium clamense TaxID=2851013 RepID=A0ABS6V3C5_9SPHN|nr:TIGR02186 family protein [Sphingomicrobium sp. B8]MBW0144049.1 TIGR02186 family protein [Sphingomicrobium sp. B8]